MNKRVKIVSTLGPAIEVRAGKTYFDRGFWAGDLDVESSAKKNCRIN